VRTCDISVLKLIFDGRATLSFSFDDVDTGHWLATTLITCCRRFVHERILRNDQIVFSHGTDTVELAQELRQGIIFAVEAAFVRTDKVTTAVSLCRTENCSEHEFHTQWRLSAYPSVVDRTMAAGAAGAGLMLRIGPKQIEEVVLLDALDYTD